MKKVFTTGTFDILHYGHINLLERAKELGDFLVVGLNVTKNGKPTYYSYEERAKVLKAIKYVDEVVPIRSQEDKYAILDLVDIFAIGDDYKGFNDIPLIEAKVPVAYIPRTPNVSSTQVKTHIANRSEYGIIVVDIDDTISHTINRDFENSIPHQDVIDKINEFHDNGWYIVLFTARGAKSCATLEERIQKYDSVTRRWLDSHGVLYDELVFGKMNADYYVDDKNISIQEFKDMPVLKRTRKKEGD